MPKRRSPITPGELLREEFLTPMGLSQYRLAKEIRVPAHIRSGASGTVESDIPKVASGTPLSSGSARL